MKQQFLKERMELLGIGEAWGWPRLPYGRTVEGERLAIRAGKANWEKFVTKSARAGVPGLLTALKNARTLHNYGIKPYDPRTIAAAVTATTPAAIVTVNAPLVPVIALDDSLDEPEAMVKPKRSANALRQARWRARRKQLSPS